MQRNEIQVATESTTQTSTQWLTGKLNSGWQITKEFAKNNPIAAAIAGVAAPVVPSLSILAMTLSWFLDYIRNPKYSPAQKATVAAAFLIGEGVVLGLSLTIVDRSKLEGGLTVENFREFEKRAWELGAINTILPAFTAIGKKAADCLSPAEDRNETKRLVNGV